MQLKIVAERFEDTADHARKSGGHAAVADDWDFGHCEDLRTNASGGQHG